MNSAGGGIDAEIKSSKVAGQGLFASAVRGLKKVDIACIGDLMLDCSFYMTVQDEPGLHQQTRMKPKLSAKPIYDAETDEKGMPREYYVSGGAASVARCLRGFDANAIVIGVVGNDHEADLFRKYLDDTNIRHSLVVSSNRPTTRKMRFYSVEGRWTGRYEETLRYDRETIQTIDSACSHELCEAIKRIEPVDAVVVSDFGKGVITQEVMEAVLELRKRKDECLLIVDPKKNKEPYCSLEIDILKPSWDEVVLMLGLPLDQTINKLNQNWRSHYETFVKKLAMEFQSCRSFIITVARHGSIIATRDDKLRNLLHLNYLEALRLNKIGNPIGFGDSYDAALAIGLVNARRRGKSWADSLWEAAYLGGCISGLIFQNMPFQMVNKEQAKQALCEVDVSNWPQIIDSSSETLLPFGEELDVEEAIKEIGEEINLKNASTQLRGYVAYNAKAKRELETFLETMREMYTDPSREEPLCILLRGPSNIGKSSLAEPIAAFLNTTYIGTIDCPNEIEFPTGTRERMGKPGLIFLDEMHRSTEHFQGSLLVTLTNKNLRNATAVAAIGDSEKALESLVGDLRNRFEKHVVFRLRPLEERRSDVPYIFLSLLKKFTGESAKGITPKAIELLLRQCTKRQSVEIRELARAYKRKVNDIDPITAQKLLKCGRILVDSTRLLTDDNRILPIIW